MPQKYSVHWPRLPVLVPKASSNVSPRRGFLLKALIGIGGVAKKSPFIMQMMADVLDMPIRIHQSEHTCALGAAMFAAAAAGIHPNVEDRHGGHGPRF